MTALALPVIVGLLLGALTSGSTAGWRNLTFRHGGVACLALLIQLVIFDPPLERLDLMIRLGPALYVGTMLAVLAVLLKNATVQPRETLRVALVAAALGVFLNCLVVTANGGYMPRVRADGWPDVVNPSEAARLVNVTPMQNNSPLPWLGDVLVEPHWMPLPNVLSIGDVLLSAGLSVWVFSISQGGRRPSWPRLNRRPKDVCLGESASI